MECVEQRNARGERALPFVPSHFGSAQTTWAIAADQHAQAIVWLERVVPTFVFEVRHGSVKISRSGAMGCHFCSGRCVRLAQRAHRQHDMVDGNELAFDIPNLGFERH